MRTEIQTELDRRGLFCPCIRCREVGDTLPDLTDGDEKPHLVERRFTAQHGEEVFLSIEARIEKRKRDDILFGFCRLRFPSEHSELVFPELEGCALVRELHVYGQLAATAEAAIVGERTSVTQHVGYGTMLMRRAEELSRKRGFKKVAVIAGVGSRGFYRKIGYTLADGKGEMMIKCLDEEVEERENLLRSPRLMLLAVAVICCAWSATRVINRFL